MRSFFREKRIMCGQNYMDVDIFRYTEIQKRNVKGKRAKKKIESAPKQNNLNDKNAKRYFRWLVHSNFARNDYHVSLTYDDEFLPATVEEAEKQAKNYLRRVAYRRKKNGLDPLKYILVTECTSSKDGEDKPTRLHHHILMNGGIDRDLLEELWCEKRKKGEKVGKSLGWSNVDRLKPNEEGLAKISNYLTKSPKRKKRWSSSQNLERPFSKLRDSQYRSRSAVENFAKNMTIQEVQKRYPGWTVAGKENGMKAIYNEHTGWSIYLRLRKDDVKDE